MHAAVVYYSVSGNTRYIAERLANQLGAKQVEIMESKPKRGFFGLLSGGFQTVLDRATALEGEPWKEINREGTVYLLTPIWAGRSAPAMRAFLDLTDFSEKEVYIITLQADPSGQGSDRAQETMRQRVEEKGGNVEQSYSLLSAPPGRFAGEEHLEEQLQRIL